MHASNTPSPISRFHVFEVARDDGGYSARFDSKCFELPGTGAMGLHYANSALVDDMVDVQQYDLSTLHVWNHKANHTGPFEDWNPKDLVFVRERSHGLRAPLNAIHGAGLDTTRGTPAPNCLRCGRTAKMRVPRYVCRDPDKEQAMNEDAPHTFTAEHRSWEWELVLQYEDGSLPATAWNEATLSVVAGWYAKHVTIEQARRRYEEHYHRNRRRLMNRLGGTAVHADALAALDGIWHDLLERRIARDG